MSSVRQKGLPQADAGGRGAYKHTVFNKLWFPSTPLTVQMLSSMSPTRTACDPLPRTKQLPTNSKIWGPEPARCSPRSQRCWYVVSNDWIAQGRDLGRARAWEEISHSWWFYFSLRFKNLPSVTCAQRLFRSAWTRDNEEMIEISLESQMGRRTAFDTGNVVDYSTRRGLKYSF